MSTKRIAFGKIPRRSRLSHFWEYFSSSDDSCHMHHSTLTLCNGFEMNTNSPNSRSLHAHDFGCRRFCLIISFHYFCYESTILWIQKLSANARCHCGWHGKCVQDHDSMLHFFFYTHHTRTFHLFRLETFYSKKYADNVLPFSCKCNLMNRQTMWPKREQRVGEKKRMKNRQIREMFCCRHFAARF